MLQGYLVIKLVTKKVYDIIIADKLLSTFFTQDKGFHDAIRNWPNGHGNMISCNVV